MSVPHPLIARGTLEFVKVLGSTPQNFTSQQGDTK